MTNDSEWPDRDEEARLLERLLAGCRTAHEELAVCYLHRLCQFLGAAHPKAREELCHQAADEALLNFLAKPSSYDATKKGLLAYLRMSAECDLLNLLAREARHRPVSLDSVAEPVDRRNRTSGCESPLDDPRVAAEYAALAPNERGVLELMCEGVRDTDEYAEVLGLLHLSAERRRAAVKRTKDRIQKRFARALGDTR